jgi:hypothetical protein
MTPKNKKREFTSKLYALAEVALVEKSPEPFRSLFTSKGGDWQACFTRLDEGRRPPVFIKGNGKLPFYAFSSLPGLDCPGAGACLYSPAGELMGGFCYSFRAWRYPAAFTRQLVNSIRLRTAAGRAEISAAWFALPKNATVRLYVDGDFHNLDTLGFWMRLCFARPDLRVYGYSKSWEILLAFAKENLFPPNYLLNLSSGGRGDDLKAAVLQLPIVRGEFVAVKTEKDHGKAYQSRRNSGFSEYARDVRSHAEGRVFVCSGKCGDCTPKGHACGLPSFRGVKIAIGIH